MRLALKVPVSAFLLLVGCGLAPQLDPQGTLPADEPELGPENPAGADGGTHDASVDAGDETQGDAGMDGGLPEDAGTWRATVLHPAPLLVPGDGGCLVPSTLLDAGTEVLVLASDGRFLLVNEQGACLRHTDVRETRPGLLPSGPKGVVRLNTKRYRYEASGCPAETDPVTEGTEVEALAKSHDLNFRGFAVAGRDLSLVPVRHVDAPAWDFPWLAGVQLVKQVPNGFVVGAGVVIGPRAILTAKHLNVDATWCYSREANTGKAWGAGQFNCTNISGAAASHPAGVDAAVVTLSAPLGPPYAKVRTRALGSQEAFFSSRWGSLHRNNFADSTVRSVGNSNAGCQTWPASTSFISTDLIIASGDSGGPAFVGAELVGLVHGEKCRWPFEPKQHVFVHVPGIVDFVRPHLPP